MTHKCESCGGIYDDTMPDGSAYYHACPPETKEARNENTPPGLQYFDRKPHLVARDPNDPARRIATPVDSTIVAEGKGRSEAKRPEPKPVEVTTVAEGKGQSEGKEG